MGMALATRPFAQNTALDEIARGDRHNVADWERKASLVLGGTLGCAAILLRNKSSILLGVLGAALIFRGSTGRCEVYRKIGINTARPHDERGVPGNRGTKVEAFEHVQKPADELFRYWRDLANLPRFMPHIISIEEGDDGISHWKVKGPLQTEVEWDSEIIEEQPGKMISWRTLPGAEVASAGSVWFEDEGEGTRVKVSLQYDPPAGTAGAAVATILGFSPEHQITEDLKQFKQLMENQTTAS